ncbi:MAG TPA: hypothetical protein VN673_05410 [Clostridia bacterium]|nr:hypothetical protein [Clostridia bacterium]
MPKTKSSKLMAGVFVGLSELVHNSVEVGQNPKGASRELRQTYQKREYLAVWPKWMVRVERRTILTEDSRKRDFTFLDNKNTRCFVRNLWFLHQFFTRRKDVLRFINSAKPEERVRLFADRAKELGSLSAVYNHWSASAKTLFPNIRSFDSTKTDLLELIEAQREMVSIEPPAERAQSSALADAIREVESRATYIQGDPKDACERALYFLELGSLEIAQTIARAELEEHPDDPVALYTNAVLSVESSKRHSQEAFLHETLHDPSLTPITAEEQWHSDRHDEAMLKAWQASENAFQLLLRCWQNWPEKFKINAWRLRPELWREQIEDVILRKAAIRYSHGRGSSGLTSMKQAQEEQATVGELVRHVLQKREKYLCKPFSVPALRDIIVVAASLWPEGGRKCLENLETAVLGDVDKPSTWMEGPSGVDLPISEDPTLSEALLGLGRDKSFCQAVVTLLGASEAITLIESFEKKGELRRCERDLARRSLTVRQILAGRPLNIQGVWEALQICRSLLPEYVDATTPLTVNLRCWWRYSVVRLLFEASCLHAQAGDSAQAVAKAEGALDLARSWFADISDPRTMARFWDVDEDGETESSGDFLRRLQNIVIDSESLDRTEGRPEWMSQYSVSPPREFIAWVNEREDQGLPLLITYLHWLSEKVGMPDGLRSKIRQLEAVAHRTNQ